MLAIGIYVVAAIAVVVIGLVAVGRETFIASHTIRQAVFDMNEAVDFVSEGLDDRSAGRLTPDDVRWILQVDADLIEEAAGGSERILDADEAAAAVLVRLDGERLANIDEQDVAAVLTLRSRYLEAIGAVGARAAGPISRR